MSPTKKRGGHPCVNYVDSIGFGCTLSHNASKVYPISYNWPRILDPERAHKLYLPSLIPKKTQVFARCIIQKPSQNILVQLCVGHRV